MGGDELFHQIFGLEFICNTTSTGGMVPGRLVEEMLLPQNLVESWIC
jgi:hypothetical protein